MSLPGFDVLSAYWLGELGEAEQAALEERLFAEPEVAARLEVVAQLGTALVELARAGRLRGTLTLAAVEKLRAAGLRIREYTLGDQEVVPCTIGSEDLMVIRLRGEFQGVESADIDLEWRLEGQPIRVEPHRAIPVDRSAGELVLVYSGDGIRALPRAGFTYRVSSQQRPLGEFHLEHTPPPA